jgi:hypothetical protein
MEILFLKMIRNKQTHIYIIALFCFTYIGGHSQTLFIAEKEELFGYVDSLGVVQIPCEYSFAYTDTLKSIAFVVDDKKIKAIDKNNNKLFTVFAYDNGPDYESDGLFRIVDDNTGHIGFSDMEGHIVISPKFFFAKPFKQGFAAFNEGGKIESFDKEHTYISGGKWGYINKQGKVVFPAIFDQASSFEEEKADVKINDVHFYLYKKTE